MKNVMMVVMMIGAMGLTACSKDVNSRGVNPPGVGGSPVGDNPTVTFPPVTSVEVAQTFEGAFQCSGSVCSNQAQFDLGDSLVTDSNDLVKVTLPQTISNGCSGAEGESCSTSLFDNAPASLSFKGKTSKTCTYMLVGSPARYQATSVACTIEVDATTSLIKTNAPPETAMRLTLKYLVWE